MPYTSVDLKVIAGFPQELITYRVFKQSFCKSQFPHRSVNLLFVLVVTTVYVRYEPDRPDWYYPPYRRVKAIGAIALNQRWTAAGCPTTHLPHYTTLSSVSFRRTKIDGFVPRNENVT